jgi:hypothetical protein
MASSCDRNSAIQWVIVGAGVAAGVVAATMILRQCGPDARARRLIARTERLADRIESALVEFEQRRGNGE